MIPRFFVQSDPGLSFIGNTPLTGSAGSLIAILDKVLINGFNSQSLTSITRVGTTATVTKVAHGLVAQGRGRQFVVHAGWDQAEYNGTFEATYVDPDHYTIQVTGTPVTPGTGAAPTGKVAPVAGWTKPYAGTNLAVYRPGSGNQHYLRIDDTGTTLARVVGYESMADVNTGTNAFPTAAQFAGGLYIPKSNSADTTTARSFVILASETTIFMIVDVASSNDNCQTWYFGETFSYKPGDAYHTVLIAGQSSSVTTSSLFNNVAGQWNSVVAGHFAARSYTQIGGSVTLGKTIDVTRSWSTSNMGNNGSAYPNPLDGGLWLSPIWFHETVQQMQRGHLAGLWAPLHNRPLNHFDTYDGVGPLAGKTFFVCNIYSGSQVHLEISDTWS